MDLQRPWSWTSFDRDVVCTLLAMLTDTDDKPANVVPISHEGFGLPTADPRSVWVRLTDEGWTSEDADFDSTQYRLTVSGRNQAEMLRARRDDPVARRKTARDTLLYWVSAEGPDAALDDFMTSANARYLDLTFTRTEIERAADFLAAEHWVTLKKSWGAIRSATATPAGDRLVESGRLVSDPRSRAGGFVTNYDQSVNISTGSGAAYTVAHSQHSPLNVSITDDHRQQLQAFADDLEEALPNLLLPAEAVELPGDVRAAAESGRSSMVRTVLQAVVTNLASSAATGLASPLGIEAHRLFTALSS